VLVRILGSFLVGCTRDIEQAVNARLHGVCALVSNLERLLRIGGIFVDHFVNQVLDRRDVLRGTELAGSVHEPS
jgi:hypothetical protein